MHWPSSAQAFIRTSCHTLFRFTYCASAVPYHCAISTICCYSHNLTMKQVQLLWLLVIQRLLHQTGIKLATWMCFASGQHLQYLQNKTKTTWELQHCWRRCAVWILTCATSIAVGQSCGLGCRHYRMIAARDSEVHRLVDGHAALQLKPPAASWS